MNEERIHTDPQTAALSERVTSLNRRTSDIENEMRTGFRQIEASMSTMANEMRSSISALSSALADQRRPQWQALAVVLTFSMGVGGLAFYPIRESTADLKTAVSSLSSRVVTREEMEWRQARAAEDRDRAGKQIDRLQSQIDVILAREISRIEAARP